ncbi:hypothetical protein Tco_0740748 [Tanacetum coccineum]
MTTPTPRRYHWEIVYPTGPKRWIYPKTGWRMIRTPYRRRVLVDTSPVLVRAKSPRSVLEVKMEEDPEGDLEEDPKEEEEEEPKKKKLKGTLDNGANSGPLEYSASKEEVESDLESTARSEAKPKELEDAP